MERKNNILKNTTFSALTTFSNLFFFLLLLFAARYLGDEDFGKFSFALALPAMFEFIANFGFGRLAIREVARDRSLAGRYLNNILPVMTILTIIALLIIVLVVRIANLSFEIKRAVYLLFVASILRNFNLVLRCFFRAYEIFEWEALTTLIERVTVLVVGTTVLFLGYGLIAFCSVFPIVRAANFLFTIYLVGKKVVRPSLKFDISFWKELPIKSFPFAIIILANSIYFRINTVMLALMRGDSEVGWYSAAFQLIEGTILLPLIITPVLFPRLSALYVESRESLLKLFENGCRYVLALAFPISFLGIVLSKKIILLFYGKQYAASSLCLQIMLSGIIPIFLRQIFFNMLAAVNQEKVFLKSMGFSLVVNCFLNLALIPRYGFIGASFSTVITEIILFGILFSFLWRSEYRFNINRNIAKPMFASMFGGAISVMFWEISPFLLIPLSGATYLTFLFLLRFWNQEELSYIKGISTPYLYQALKIFNRK